MDKKDKKDSVPPSSNATPTPEKAPAQTTKTTIVPESKDEMATIDLAQAEELV